MVLRVVEVPPLAEVGERTSEARAAGLTVRVAVRVVAPRVAERAPAVFMATGLVETANWTEVAPAGR